jgi:uncharacterized protein YcfL
MKKIIKKIAMAAALTTALSCTVAHGAEGGSMASKIETLGPLTSLAVRDLRAAKRDGLLHIQVTISNITQNNQQLYYRFRWLDSDGFSVWEEEPWKPEVIYSQQNKLINVVSPSFKATDFRLELKTPE